MDRGPCPSCSCAARERVGFSLILCEPVGGDGHRLPRVMLPLGGPEDRALPCLLPPSSLRW